jgi:YD repeat-containing protein
LTTKERPSESTPRRFSKVYQFDDYGRLLATVDQLGRKVQHEYDSHQPLTRKGKGSTFWVWCWEEGVSGKRTEGVRQKGSADRRGQDEISDIQG